MDTYVPHRIPAEPLARSIPEYHSIKSQVADTIHRVQDNVQNMPLTSFVLAVLVGVAVGTLMTRASYGLHLR